MESTKRTQTITVQSSFTCNLQVFTSIEVNKSFDNGNQQTSMTQYANENNVHDNHIYAPILIKLKKHVHLLAVICV